MILEYMILTWDMLNWVGGYITLSHSRLMFLTLCTKPQPMSKTRNVVIKVSGL